MPIINELEKLRLARLANKERTMNSTLLRQLKDIQHQAENLISGSPEIEELEQFGNYNEELKTYILENIDLSEISNLVYDIPNVLHVELGTKSRPIGALIIVGIITLGISSFYISYVVALHKKRLIQSNIQTARGKYASIEFLLKAYV